MDKWFGPVIKFFHAPPKRAFYLYPLIVLLWELVVRNGKLVWEPPCLILMVWGYGQFRFSRSYHRKAWQGGPDRKPVERLITSGIYRYIRNPMYMGQIIFLIGLSLTLQSLLSGLITIGTAVWFHYRVLGEEHRMIELYRDDYRNYMQNSKRWIPGLF